MSSDTFANLVKSSTVSIPLEEYLKLEPYIKQVYDIQTLKDENKRLKDALEKQNQRLERYYSRELWDSHLREIETLWMWSQTGENAVNVLGKLQRLTTKIRISINDEVVFDDYDAFMYKDSAFTVDGPFCVKDCTDIDAFCEKVLHCFESESFRKSYSLPPK